MITVMAKMLFLSCIGQGFQLSGQFLISADTVSCCCGDWRGKKCYF